MTPEESGDRGPEARPESPPRGSGLWRVAAVLGWAGVIGLSVALIAVLPKALSYDDLLDENLSMRGRVQELDRRMAEVDRILMRLRIYDAQMRGLGDIPEGDHGPTEDIDDPPPDAQVDPDPDPGDDGPYDQVEVGEIGQELRPSGAWADAIIARADSFLAVFEEAEPDLNALVEELEGLRALEEALPSHWPTTGTLTSGFGYRRSPFGRKAQFHKGLDISNARGTPVVASGPGTVRSAFYNGGYGRFIEVDHGYGITTRYAHLHRLLVKEGDEVERGQLIGTVGRTGRVTGPHLHFEVRIDGHAVDPLDYLPR